MVASATVPGLTNLPASLSSTVITGVLRGQLGFAGLVITDSLSATGVQAAGYPVPGAAVQALRAGGDMVLFNATPTTVASLARQVVAAIVAAVSAGSLTRTRLETAVGHILPGHAFESVPAVIQHAVRPRTRPMVVA
jgi:beta-N-acetylhexosaminidase